MLTPTIFIGLGSTGNEVLENLYDLMEEHYGNYLPEEIFKFIVFETEPPRVTKKRINAYHITVRSTDEVLREIENDRYSFYDQWLEIKELNVPSITDGAKNRRMLGRFCLWHNWTTLESDRNISGIKGIIRNAYNDVGLTDSIRKTNRNISDFYALKRGSSSSSYDNLIREDVHFYIVGTLCGGTCSGMFYDIAYLCKEIGGLWALGTGAGTPKPVRGFFTIMDSSDLGDTGEQKRRWAANCWAAILELDYYSHPATKYKFVFPDGSQLSTSEQPLDLCYLLSMSAPPTRGRESPRITNDLKTLNHQLALALFCEVAGDLRERVDGIITDFDAIVDRAKYNERHSMRIVSTFGICAYWYPKLRVAGAAGCKFTEKEILEKEWLGQKPDPNRKDEINREAESFVSGLINEGRQKLQETYQENLRDQILNFFNLTDLLDKPQDELNKIVMNEFQKFNQNRHYDEVITKRIDSCTNYVRNKLNIEIRSKLNALSEDNMTLIEILHWLDQVIELIHKRIEEFFQEYPSKEIPRFTHTVMKSDLWIRSTGFKKKLNEWENEYNRFKKEQYIEEAKSKMLELLEAITDYRLKNALENIIKRLSGELSQRDRRAGIKTIKEELDRINRVIKNELEEIRSQYERICAIPKPTEDLEVVYQEGSIKEDAEILLATKDADKNEIIKEVLRDLDIATLLQFNPDGPSSAPKLAQKFEEVCTRKFIDHIRGFDIAGTKLGQIRDVTIFTNYSNPHLELTGELPSQGMERKPNLILGFGDSLLPLQEALENNGKVFERERIKSSQEIDHLLVYYQAEHYCFKDNLITSRAEGLSFEKRLEELDRRVGSKRVDKEGRGVPYIFTHKYGREFFDPMKVLKEEEAEKLIKIAKDIFSEREEKELEKFKYSEVFRIEKGELIYDVQLGREHVQSFLIDGVMEKMIKEEDFFESFKNRIENELVKIRKEGFEDKLGRYYEWYLNYLTMKEKRNYEEAIRLANEEVNWYEENVKNKYYQKEE